MTPARDMKAKTGKRLRTFERRLLAVLITAAVVTAGFAFYYSLGSGHSGRTLVVYTYSSFLAYGSNKTAAFNAVFGTFEREYNVNIVVRTPQLGLLQELELNKNHPQANLVIGLNNIDGVKAVHDGLLLRYTPPGDRYVNSTLLEEMGSAADYITPYEYAYLGIDYNVSVISHGQNFRPTFPEIASNRTLAENLLMEYPEYSATGEAFLLWQIAYYTYVLHQNWTEWWKQIAPYTQGHIFQSWSEAFSKFNTGNGTDMVVSYATDPAYNEYFGYGSSVNSTVVYSNNTAYGWRTIYGIGIVNHSSDTSLSEKFVNYFLSPTVQSELPLNEWMYPANSTVPLPPVFRYAIDPSYIFPLNTYINATEISGMIGNWIDEWILIMS
ncbi:MAG: thiamine ABC transporter substrate-binding protein [Thermoplasmata archaeon]|uniref:Thiamine ABC transporter substrate-binding protein n=1 Tax=Candidatus Sysuiplasma superficiale TaxID=2823368 RepID=A0A8J7YTU7_9ARCH|nr:thiamine ABC transporter substrate-binding protein [Candidatus Sysuiplasma superficiale]MBX8644392.1 thiamine ABC transporter substrate-binding protein [Candidatus Sysuiplasma superficiale]